MAISTAEILGSDAQKLQQAFIRNGITIDLASNDGLNTMLINGSEHNGIRYPFEESAPEGEQETALQDLADHIYGRKGKGALIFKPGEAVPRFLYYDEKKQDFVITETISRISQPEAPGFLHRLLHFLTGSYQDEFDAYNTAKTVFDNAKALTEDPNYQNRIEEHRTDLTRMYKADQQAAKERVEFQKAAAELNELNQEALSESIDQYDPLKTLNDELDAMYGEVESMRLANRQEFILIEGIPVKALMYSEYVDKTNHRSGFTNENEIEIRKQRFNEIVAGALAAGKRIDCYIPDKNTGLLPEKPVSLHINFNAPGKLLPFAEKLPALPQDSASMRYARLAEADRNIRRVAAFNAIHALGDGGSGKLIKETMFGTDNLESIPNRLNFSTGRTAATSLVYAYLVNQGYSIEQLEDPHRFLAEKREAGKLVMEKLAAGDGNWIVEQEILGRAKICEEVGKRYDQMELKDPAELYRPENIWLCKAAEVLFDLDQEETHLKKHLQEVIQDPQKPAITEELHDYVVNAANGLLGAPKGISLGEYESACAQLGMAYKCGANAMATVTGKMLFELIKERKSEKTVPFAESVVPSDFGLVPVIQNAITMDPDVFETVNGPDGEKQALQYQKDLCKFADLGGIAKNLKAAKNEMGTYEVKFTNASAKAPADEFVKKMNKEANVSAAPKVK